MKGRNDNKIKTIRVILALMIILWMAVIFALSMDTAVESSEKSDVITETIARLIYGGYDDLDAAKQEEICGIISVAVRKTSHFVEYGVLGFLIASLMLTWRNMAYFKKTIPPSLAAGFLYAVSDEVHQLFVDGRSARVTDVIIDTAGVLAGAFMASFIMLVIVKGLRKKHLRAA